MAAQDGPPDGPIHRIAARVLPVNERGEVLLLQGQDPARPGDLHWVSVGGAVDEGETRTAAAVRELLEETGIVAEEAELVGPVATGVHPFSWAGVDYVSDSTFYALALPADTPVSFDGLEPGEVGNVLRAAWWTPDALRADGSAASDDMPDVMTAAIEAIEAIEATRATEGANP